MHRVHLPPIDDSYEGEGKQRVTRSRFSIPYFVTPKSDTLLESLDIPVAAGEKQKYESITYRKLCQQKSEGVFNYWWNLRNLVGKVGLERKFAASCELSEHSMLILVPNVLISNVCLYEFHLFNLVEMGTHNKCPWWAWSLIPTRVSVCKSWKCQFHLFLCTWLSFAAR